MSKLIATFVLLTVASASFATAPAKVLLLPFDAVGPADKAWVAKAIQQNLVAELGRVNSVQAVTADQPAADLDAALKVASGAAADFVVFGTFQAVDADLRITEERDAHRDDAVGMGREPFLVEPVVPRLRHRQAEVAIAAT